MTMPLTSKAFDIAMPYPPALRRVADDARRCRALAMVATAVLHVAVAVGLIAGVHVASRRPLPALMVQISPARQKVAQDVAPPPPMLQRPSIIAVAPPVVMIQTAPSPVLAQQQVVTPMPPPPAATPQKADGERSDAFLARLLGQLNRFKQYPRAARQAHIEGVAMLHFVMDADGRILSAEIAQSSGRALLDAEALALIRRAQPLPALPADFPTRTLDAVVPIEFSLNG